MKEKVRESIIILCQKEMQAYAHTHTTLTIVIKKIKILPDFCAVT